MRDWLRLVRLPNHATAVADVLAGFLVCSGMRALDWPPAACWLAIVASVCFYAAGMVLNDVYDVALDRQERPERPLPRGAIGLRRAAAVGSGLLAAGSAAACATAVVSGSPWPAFVGAALTAAVWAYDRHAKSTPLGPAVMGGCRALNWLLGMTAAGGPAGLPQWLIPLGMGTYVAGITVYARDEAVRSRTATLLCGMILMLGGLVLAAGHVWLPARSLSMLGGAPLPVTTWLALWGIIGASILARAAAALVDPAPGRVQAAVGNAIMSIITLDAVLVLASCGERWAVVVLLLLAFFVFGRRLVPPT